MRSRCRVEFVKYLDVDRIICPGGTCNAYLDGRPVYFDAFHLSMDGSWLVGRKAFGGGGAAARDQ